MSSSAQGMLTGTTQAELQSYWLEVSENRAQGLHSSWRLRKEIQKMKASKEGPTKSDIYIPLKSLADCSTFVRGDFRNPEDSQQLEGWERQAEIFDAAHCRAGRVWSLRVSKLESFGKHPGLSIETQEGHILGLKYISLN